MGIWLKNARAAARKAAQIERRRAEGLPVKSSAGALSEMRREQLQEIDESWCPAWPVTWQRCFHLVRMHLNAGEALPTRRARPCARARTWAVGNVGEARVGPAEWRAAVDV
ncbi:hypothetical protein ACWDZ4_28375 [Streptomyces sp. NPDC003016]